MLERGLAEQLTHMVFRQTFVMQNFKYIKAHQFATPEFFDVFNIVIFML